MHRVSLSSAEIPPGTTQREPHNVVEYGCGTNFVIDELLKTRAGENVLALFSAVASVYEDDFGTVITALYDRLKMPSHSTPSLSQLEKLRSLCLSLVRKMSFKDQLAETYHWINAEFIRRKYEMSKAFPDPRTVAELVMTLNDLAKAADQRKNKLVYYGTRGAAWVMVYSWMILRLPVCLVLNDGKTHPVQQGTTYSSCPVILYPEVEGPSSIWQSIDKPSDVIVLGSDEFYENRALAFSVSNWQISCGAEGADVIKLMCGWDISNRQELGNIIYTIAHEYIQFRMMLHVTAGTNEGVQTPQLEHTYVGRNMDTVSTALERVLMTFGLPGNFCRIPGWRKRHFARTQPTDAGNYNWQLIDLDMYSRMISYVGEIHEHCNHQKLRPLEMKISPLFCLQCRMLAVVVTVAYISSTLAFTDWADHFKMLSSTFFRTVDGENFAVTFPGFSELVDWEPGRRPGAIDPTETSDLALDHVSLARQVCKLCSGSLHAEDIITSNQHKFLGLNIDGMLLILYRAIETTLLPGPVLVVREGDFSLYGDRRPVLSGNDLRALEDYHDEEQLFDTMAPWNKFANHLRLSVTATLLKESIQLNYRLDYFHTDGSRKNHTLSAYIPILQIPQGLDWLYVTSACQHSARRPVNVTKVAVNDDFGLPLSAWSDDTNGLWLIHAAILSYMAPNFSGMSDPVCYYLPVANNHLAQWAATASLIDKIGVDAQSKIDSVAILQDKACLACTRDQAKQWKCFTGGRIFILSGHLR